MKKSTQAQIHHSHLSSETHSLVRQTSTRLVAGALAIQAANMVKAIRVYEHGGPEVLKWEDVEIGEPKEDEIRVKNIAIGFNFIDVYFRKGVYKPATLPFIPDGKFELYPVRYTKIQRIQLCNLEAEDACCVGKRRLCNCLRRKRKESLDMKEIRENTRFNMVQPNFLRPRAAARNFASSL